MSYFDEGNKLYRNKQYEEAIELYKKTIENEPKSIGARYNIGTCYIKLFSMTNSKNTLHMAVKYFIEVLTIDNKHQHATFNLAYSYFKLNNYKKAYIYANRSVALNNEDRDSIKLLSELEKLLEEVSDET